MALISPEKPVKQEHSIYFTAIGIKNDKGNVGSQFEETVTCLSWHCHMYYVSMLRN